MIRRARYLAPVLALALVWGCANPEESANKLFVEATALVTEGQQAEGKSYTAAHDDYKQALARIHEIREKFATTKVAVQLGQDGAKVGPFAVGDLEAIVLPQIARKATAESSPLQCAEYLARSVSENYGRANALCAVADELTKAGHPEQTKPLLDEALVAAKGLPAIGMYGPVDGYRLVADSYVKAKNFTAAQTLIDQFNMDDERLTLAAGLAEAGQLPKAQAVLDKLPPSNVADRARGLALVAGALLKKGQTAQATPLLARARKLAQELGDEDTSVRATIEEQARAGKEADPSTGIEKNPSWLRSAAWEDLDQLLAAHKANGKSGKLLGLVHDQLKAVDEDAESSQAGRAQGLAKLAYLQAKLGEGEKALFTLGKGKEIPEQMVAAEKSMEETELALAKYERADALLALGEGAIRVGQLQDGALLLDAMLDMLESAPGYPSEFDKKSSLTGEAAMAFSLGGNLDKALATVQRITNKEYAAAFMARLEGAFQGASADAVATERARAVLHEIIAKN